LLLAPDPLQLMRWATKRLLRQVIYSLSIRHVGLRGPDELHVKLLESVTPASFCRFVVFEMRLTF
jgi:hypothetical protein